MNELSTFAERFRRAVTTQTHGVLGLVDELLALSSEHGLQLGWHAGNCRGHFLTDAPEVWIEAPLRKSVFRAVLARIAVLCNVRKPNSVSPYGGQGELAVGSDPNSVLRVAFTNTPDEQSLELFGIPLRGTVDPCANKTSPLSDPPVNGDATRKFQRSETATTG